MSTATITTPRAEGLRQELPDQIARIYRKQQEFFASGATRSYAFRKTQLKKLGDVLKAYEDRLIEAVSKDFRKSPFETYGTEIAGLYGEVRHTIRDLRNWMRPKRVSTPIHLQPSSSWMYPEPLGITLIISPWNYPVLLLLRPLISSMAAGNTVILKPSEITAHTAAVLDQMIRENFDEEYVASITGDGEIVGRELLDHYHFDHVFFTGSVPVGRKIMEMAAKHLSPVTLELGGKSPCIVDKDVNITFAARKIAWGKLVNCGQTCVAPDYLLVHEEVKEKFLEALKAAIRSMYGDDPRTSPDYPRMVSDRRFQAVRRFLADGKIIFGGEVDASERYIAPTLIEDVSANDQIMKEEIFGPVLPIITYRDKQEIYDWVAKNPYPLALYIFTSNSRTAEAYIEGIRFGGGCVNNTLIHLGNPELPFGGVGTSGIGEYHGEHGFKTFSRIKSVVKTPTWLDFPLWYAPYGNNLKWIKKILK